MNIPKTCAAVCCACASEDTWSGKLCIASIIGSTGHEGAFLSAVRNSYHTQLQNSSECLPCWRSHAARYDHGGLLGSHPGQPRATSIYVQHLRGDSMASIMVWDWNCAQRMNADDGDTLDTRLDYSDHVQRRHVPTIGYLKRQRNYLPQAATTLLVREYRVVVLQ
jgi:hypothetical protein